MFTGLIEEIGTIAKISPSAKGASIAISASEIMKDIKIGDSIATNGICLTVTAFDERHFTVDVMAETMRMTGLSKLKPGTEVNLERAMLAGGRLGGHIVSGHIDGTGTIQSYEREDNAIWITIKAVPELLKYIVRKGSIAIDGVSLTVANIDDTSFQVSIIPHTSAATTLTKKQPGDIVNLECDIVGKYIEKLMQYKQAEKKESVDRNLLEKYGFL